MLRLHGQAVVYSENQLAEAGCLQSEPKFALLTVYPQTLVRIVGDGQHAQHARACTS